MDRVVSVKMLSKPEHYGPFTESVRNSVRVGEHPSILTVYGGYLEGDPPYYVKRFVNGGSLRSVLNDVGGPLSIDSVRRMLYAIGKAVEHSHQQNVRGLNLKPTNVLVQNSNEPHAKYYLGVNSYDSMLIQTEAGKGAMGSDVVYMAPESRVPGGFHTPDPAKADQYRLGLIAYESLIGSPRFQEIAKSLASGTELSGGWPRVRDIRRDSIEYVSRVVDRMISWDPDFRYACVGDAVRDLQQADIDVEMVRDNYRFLMETEEMQDDFLKSFYLRLLAYLQQHAPECRALFNNFGTLTREAPPSDAWRRQFMVLKEAILLLVVYKAFHEDGRTLNILTRIAKYHTDRNLPGDLHWRFKECLIETVVAKNQERHGPLNPDELGSVWDRVITPGITYMANFKGLADQARGASS